MKNKRLVIDPEFAKLLDAHSPGELSQLEENLLRDGCIDPIIVWKETGIVLDGMTRHPICVKHKLDFKVKRFSFHGRDEAAAWIIDTQTGRRNVSETARGKLRDERQKRIEEALKNGFTQEEVAAKEGVSRRRVRQITGKNSKARAGAAQETSNSPEKTLVDELKSVSLSPKIEEKIKELPPGKQKDLAKLIPLHGISKAYQMVTKEREPGDEAPPKKAGAVVFGWKEWDAHFGVVARGPDEVAKAYEGDHPEKDQCLNFLAEFRRTWTAWRKRLTKSSV